jgi:outer membrane protein W
MILKNRLLTFVAAVSLFGSVTAQNNQSGDFKFSANDRNVEVQYAGPFTGSPFSMPVIKLRYFNTDNTALRLRANISSNSSTTPTERDNSDGKTIELKDKSSSFQFMVAPGYEMHFSGTNRLSPYIGGEAVIDYKSSSEREESFDVSTGNSVVYKKTSNQDPGYFGFSLNGVAGFDFYLTKSLYLGVEVNYGLTLKSNLSTKVKTDDKDVDEVDPVKNGGSFSFQPSAIGQYRLGFIF